jgi:hypothetical protein
VSIWRCLFEKCNATKNNIKRIWDEYSNKLNYANGIKFEDTLDSMGKLSKLLL